MGKSKHAPALFEVVQGPKDAKTPNKLALPTWWKNKPADQASRVVAEKSTESETPTATVEAPPPEAVEPRQEVPDEIPEHVPQDRPSEEPTELFAEPPDLTEGGFEHRPILSVCSGRVELSLNPVGVVVVAGGLLLALMFSYQLGRNLGPAKSAPLQADVNGEEVAEVEEAGQQTPNPAVFDIEPPISRKAQPAGDDRDVRKAVPAPPAGRKAGLHYVVLQIFPADHRRAAEAAQAWLAAHGIQATVEPQGSQHCKLLSLEDFGPGNPADQPEYLEYRSKVQSLGKQLAAELAKADLPRYDLRDPYPQLFGK